MELQSYAKIGIAVSSSVMRGADGWVVITIL